MKENKSKLTLYQPAAYQIKAQGQLEGDWFDWAEKMSITVEFDRNGHTVSTLTGIVDQAALQGLLRLLYSMGIPLISVICLDVY